MGDHHDSLFRACFAELENARSWLRWLLPALRTAIDWDELRPWPAAGTTPSGNCS